MGTMDKRQTAANFGLVRTLNIPIHIKIHSLTGPKPTLAAASQKLASASIFKTLSHISANSSLFVRVQVYDGNHNAVCQQVQTPFRQFTGNKRVWDSHLRLPVNYNQLGYDSYLAVEIYEMVDAKPVIYGHGTLSIFDHSDCTLRKGVCRVQIQEVHRVPKDGNERALDGNERALDGNERALDGNERAPDGNKKGPDGNEKRPDGNKKRPDGNEKGTGSKDIKKEVSYGPPVASSFLEHQKVQYQNGDLHQLPWLDTKAWAAIPEPKEPVSVLQVELPNFSLPIVYSDTTYRLSAVAPRVHDAEEMPETRVLSAVAIPGTRIYDPDFNPGFRLAIHAGSDLNDFKASGSDQFGPGLEPVHTESHAAEPIELKLQKLASVSTNINSSVDREIKPSPHMRDELWRILNRPSSAVLSDYEKRNLWKYRFYFSQNSAADPSAAPSQSTKQFLTKFLKCFNWENEAELDHVFADIFPYWSVDRIDIGDALELLSNNFNPHVLSASLRHPAVGVKDVSTADETKISRIYECCRRLRNFAVQRLTLASADELRLYLLQLVQALKYEDTNAPGNENASGAGNENASGNGNRASAPKSDPLADAPLASFLIQKSVQNAHLGNFFYWYVKVENEDQLMHSEGPSRSIYNIVMNTYIDKLKKHCAQTSSPQYTHLKRQIAFVKKLTGLVELLRASFKKNEATGKKVQFLQEYLADPANGLLKFPEPFPLPLDPNVIICGCYPAESSVFKSSLSPLKITFKTVTNFGRKGSASIFGARSKHGKYPLMFKIGDDLRQDQLVIQIINLMDQLLKNENLNLKLTPYKILATSPIAGFIQFVPNETLDSVLSKNLENNGSKENGILKYLQLNSRKLQSEEPEENSILGIKTNPLSSVQQQTIVSDLGVSTTLMDNYVKSCAGYCVITYILGVGDRHLDNLLLSPNGKFWHADFGYILGRDPKPFPPLMKLPIQVIDGMGGMNHENFNIFKSYCFITYTTLRRNSNLILNLFQLMLNANIPDIQIDPTRAVEKVQDKFALEMTEEEAILHFQNLIIDSVNAFLPVVIDTLHSLAQYWRA